MIQRILAVTIWSFGWLLAFGGVLWAFGAIYYDFPAGSVVALLFAASMAAVIIFLRGAGRKLAAVFAAFALVLIWWFTQRPKQDRPWQPDVSQTASAEISGDEVTLHNVRNCDYRTEQDFTPVWETRRVRLSQLTGTDIAICTWGSDLIAHPILSFQFTNSLPVAISVETRKEIGESYSAIGGFYRQYELIYIVADERDVVRVRTNYRKGEDVHLYRSTFSVAETKQRFLEYLRSINELHERPRWYNALTTNCTTAVRSQRPRTQRMPFDWRILANGRMDELFYERGVMVTDGLPCSELKKRALINPVAQAADKSSEFSQLIRSGRPGFGVSPPTN